LIHCRHVISEINYIFGAQYHSNGFRPEIIIPLFLLEWIMVDGPVEFFITAPSPASLPLNADKVPKITEGNVCCLPVFGQGSAETRFFRKGIVDGNVGTDSVPAGVHALVIEEVDMDIEIVGEGECIGDAGAYLHKTVDVEEISLIQQAVMNGEIVG